MGLLDAVKQKVGLTQFHHELDRLYKQEGIVAVIAAIDQQKGADLASIARDAARHFERVDRPGIAFKIAHYYGDTEMAKRMYLAALDACDRNQLYVYALKLARIMGDEKDKEFYAGLAAGSSAQQTVPSDQQTI